MADNVAVSPGAGVIVASDDCSGVQYQRVKLDGGQDGLTAPILGTTAQGLLVDVSRVQGNVQVIVGAAVPVTDNAASLTVDTPQLPALLVGGALPVHVQSGVALPVSDASGSLTTDTPQLPSSLVGGRLDVHIGGAAATVPVSDAGGTLTVDDGGGALTVDGTVAANQGTAAAVGQAWPVKISDGTSTVGITDVSGQKALKVDVIAQTGAGTQADKSGFTEGAGLLRVVGGVLNDTPGADPAEDQAAAVRITPKRAQHVNLRSQAGTEIGTAGAPVRVDPTGSTTQPVLGTHDLAIKTAVELIDDTVGTVGAATPGKGVIVAGTDGTNARALKVRTDGQVEVHDGGNSLTVDGTVTANQGGAPWSQNLTQVAGAAIATAASGIAKVGLTDEAGAAFGVSNGVPIESAPLARAQVNFDFSRAASAATAVGIWTPTGGTRFVVRQIILTVTTAGVLKIFDETDATGRYLYKGTIPIGLHVIEMPEPGFVSGAVNRLLRFSTDGTIVFEASGFGYEV